MRKFITILVAVIAMFSITSCNSCSNESKFGIQYSIATNGKTDDAVSVDFVNGHFDITGAANYNFKWASDTTHLSTTNNVYKLDEALKMNDIEVVNAASRANEWLEESIKVTSFTGHYLVHIEGYIMETLTGLKFEVDRTFSNYPEE